MADIIGFAASAVLAIAFGWSALTKLLRPSAWWDALGIYRLGSIGRRVASIAVVAAEAGVVVLVVGGAAAAAGALATALLAAFSFGLLRARQVEGDRLPCGCFGSRERRDYRLLLGRNVLLLIPAVASMTLGPKARPPSVEDAVPVALVIVGLSILGWTASQVAGALRQRGDR